MGGEVENAMGGFGYGPGEAKDPFFGGAQVDDIEKAGEMQAQGVREGRAAIEGQFQSTQQSLQPRIEAQGRALDERMALIGMSGPEAQQRSLQAIEASPGQQFLRDRAQRNLVRNASAIGGLGGGNVRSALVQQGVGFAQQDIENQFGRLGQIGNQGQAARDLGQFGAQASGNIAGMHQAESEARASGVLGAAGQKSQAQAGAVNAAGTVLGAIFSDERLKEDITLVGTDENGGVYRFKYLWSPEYFIGRMAQELREIRPDAVTEHSSGFLQVSAEFAPVVV